MFVRLGIMLGDMLFGSYAYSPNILMLWFYIVFSLVFRKR